MKNTVKYDRPLDSLKNRSYDNPLTMQTMHYSNETWSLRHTHARCR